MFVKIENWDGGTPLILNVDRIVAIRKYNNSDVSLFPNKEKYSNGYIIRVVDGHKFWLNEEQYIELCKILTTRG